MKTTINSPVLRFPNFTEEWKNCVLGDVTFKVGKKNKEGVKYPIYSINNKEGFTAQGEQFEGLDSNVRGYDISIYKLIEKNTFAYNPARINVGSIGYSRELHNIIVSSLYVCFKTNENLNDNLLWQYVRSLKFNKAVLSLLEGGVRQYLFYENFSKIKFCYPNLIEQEKIASFLTAVDDKIQQLQKKKQLLEQYKKGVMQQIFTQQLRFKDDEGNDYPEWKNMELKDAVEFWDSKRKPIKESDRGLIKGKYPYYGASGIIDYVNDFIFDDELILLGEDGANIITRSSPLAFKVRGKIWVNNHAHVLKPKENVNISYLVEYLESLKFDKYNSGTAQPKLNQEACAGIPIVLPCKAEQGKIAIFFDGIINKINLIKTEIEQTQNFKKGLLQQMFV